MGVGKTWRIIMAKCGLNLAGQETKEPCRTDQLGMEALIEGDIHAIRLLWQQHVQEED